MKKYFENFRNYREVLSSEYGRATKETKYQTHRCVLLQGNEDVPLANDVFLGPI